MGMRRRRGRRRRSQGGGGVKDRKGGGGTTQGKAVPYHRPLGPATPAPPPQVTVKGSALPPTIRPGRGKAEFALLLLLDVMLGVL